MPSVALNDIDHMRESVFFDQRVTPAPTAKKRAVNRRNAILVIVAFFAILIPLVTSAVRIANDRARESEVRQITRTGPTASGGRWSRCPVPPAAPTSAIGSPPIPPTASYAESLRAGGIDPDTVVVEFIPRTVVQVGSDEGLVPD